MPAALPSVFVGLRLGLIFAMINIVGVEFLINFGGLGQLINELAERYDLPGTPIRLFLRSQSTKNPFKDQKFHTPSRLRKHIEGKGRESLKR